MTQVNYSKRVVFFVDILGFKNIVQEKIGENYKNSAEYVSAMFDKIADFDIYKQYDPNIRSQILRSTKITQFSDSLVVSFEITDPSQLFNCLGQMQWVIYNLAQKGVFLRGAAGIGDLFHNDSYVFGPALNEAYELESKVAQHPRIIIKDEILDVCANFSETPYCISGVSKEYNQKLTKKSELEDIKKYLQKDGDGYFYIDYFTSSAFFAAGGNLLEYSEYMKDIKQYIQDNIKSPNISIVSKYMWMKEKYNLAIQELPAQLLKDANISQIN